MPDGLGHSKAPSVTPHANERAPEAPKPETPAPAAPRLGWRDVWQLPTLLVATSAVVGGLIYISRIPREHDFPGALDQVDGLVAAGRLDEARLILFDRLSQRLDEAQPADKARYEATTADWLAAARIGTSAIENDQQIADRYNRAEQAGLPLSRERLLRLAAALVHLGRADDALDRVSRVEAAPGEADLMRARVRRLVVERSWEDEIKSEHPDRDKLLMMLGTYRADAALSTSDEAWAAARQAELRLALDRSREAADRLLLDVRRLESNPKELEPTVTQVTPEEMSELLSLLGRAYVNLGESDLARDVLEGAAARTTQKTLPKGEALVMLGQLALQRGELDEAEMRFESVLADYAGEGCSMLALFGRAEARAARGDHLDALADFRDLRTKVNANSAKRVVVDDVLGSLLDRHDALLVAGDLEQALEYARLASDFVPSKPPSGAVLRRLATTANALANRLASGAESQDPETRVRVSRLLKSAGDWFRKHAVNRELNVEAPTGWADSTWMAADCYERSGWSDDAIAAFRDFVDNSPKDEPRRSEAMFRVAAVLHGDGRLDEAATEYARVIDEFPNSPLAARASVPLARCLESLSRRADAIARLRPVVEGATGLRPDAEEYREAILELARLVVTSGDLDRGATLLDEALRRYPNDARVAQTRFQLGECRRGQASEAMKRLTDGALSPSQVASIDEKRRADLETARAEFDRVVAMLEVKPATELDPLDRDALRMSHLYRADCLFDLGRYREAIDLYEIAERRYDDSAVSMIALIQIVNAWHELGETERAATAHRRAEIRLAQLPDSAFLGGDSIFRREAWERWLKSNPPGLLIGSTAATRSPSEREVPE